MIRHLYIENYALIRKLDISFFDGFSVITGETGAGKSILLGALGLILGERSDTAALFDKDSKCIVEGSFELDEFRYKDFFSENDLDFETVTIIRREVNPAGKSRAFINDTPVNLNILKIFGDILVDIHSQHEHLLLKESGFQLNVLDHYTGNNELRELFHTSYNGMQQIQKELRELKQLDAQSRLDEEFFRFQLKELTEAAPEAGESTRLESEHELMTHSEDIKRALLKAGGILQNSEPSVLEHLNEIKNVLEPFEGYSEQLADLFKRLKSSLIELKDLAQELDRLENKIQYDPEELERIRERLDLLYTLQKKHRLGHADELIPLRDELDAKLEGLQSLSDRILEVDQNLATRRKEVADLAQQLHDRRSGALPEFCGRITGILVRLGMPDCTFRVSLELLPEPGPAGHDKISFLFNANKGGVPAEIQKTASGGEMSRIMLTLKSVVSARQLLPTLIFDEIDMGVSGKTADMVGQILQEIARDRQVIVITHLPQIASRGNHHYFVYKQVDESLTKTQIRELREDERIMEIARLISGENISPAAMETARELLTNN